MPPYINAHTHHFRESAHVVSVVNCLYGEALPSSIFSAGLHPWYLNEEEMPRQWEWLLEATSHPKCLAIGECGLDRLKGPPIPVQQYWLEQQAQLAEKLQKPMIIHCVRAYDLLGAWAKRHPLKVPVMIHGFRQRIEVMQPLQKQGFKFSFGIEGVEAASSFKSMKHHANSFLLETDVSPALIEEVYHLAAQQLQMEGEALKRQLHQNFCEWFLPNSAFSIFS